MREHTCCFSGHREIDWTKKADLQRRLSDVIDELYDEGIYYFGCGGARGFDLLAAAAVIDAKKVHSGIRLILVMPYKNQTVRYTPAEKAEHERLRQAADKVVCLQEEYSEGCLHRRNRHLVDESSVCVCYLSKSAGGTLYTVDYARQQGLKIINLATD